MGAVDDLQSTFRDAMARVAAPVTVITTTVDGVPTGIDGPAVAGYLWLGVVVAVVVNAVVAPLVLVPMFGWGFFIGSLVPLLVGAVANVAVGVIVARALAAAGLAETPTK